MWSAGVWGIWWNWHSRKPMMRSTANGLIPKALFQEQRFQNLSTDAKTLYGILLDRMSLSVKNEWFDKKGRVFIIFTIEDVKRTLRCADNKATRLLRELEEFGLMV